MNTLLLRASRLPALLRPALLRPAVVLAVLSLLLLPAARAQEATPIELENPSFEEPGSEQRDFANVPGWSMDASPDDSGVGQNDRATDGIWAAWLASQDGAVWQTTDYVIQAGDVITMAADVHNSWLTTLIELRIYYDDDGTRVPVAVFTHDFEGIVTQAMEEFSVTFRAADVPEAVGRTLGVEIDNTSDDGAYIEFDNVRLTRSTATSAEGRAELPGGIALRQNYPNPFNPETVIEFELERADAVRLEVFDLLGRRVRLLADGALPAGLHRVRWDAIDDVGVRVPSGVYLYRLSARPDGAQAARTMTRAMMLVQ